MPDVVSAKTDASDQTTPGAAPGNQIISHRYSLAESSNIVCIMHIKPRPDRIVRRIIGTGEPALGVGVITDVASGQSF